MVISALGPSVSTASHLVLEKQQLPGQKGITAPICPGNKRGKCSA